MLLRASVCRPGVIFFFTQMPRQTFHASHEAFRLVVFQPGQPTKNRRGVTAGRGECRPYGRQATNVRSGEKISKKRRMAGNKYVHLLRTNRLLRLLLCANMSSWLGDGKIQPCCAASCSRDLGSRAVPACHRRVHQPAYLTAPISRKHCGHPRGDPSHFDEVRPGRQTVDVTWW